MANNFLARLKRKQTIRHLHNNQMATDEKYYTDHVENIIHDAVEKYRKAAELAIETSVNGLANVLSVAILMRLFRFTVEEARDFLIHLTHKAECIDKGYATFVDMVRYEVRQTKDYGLGWSAYQPQVFDVKKYQKLLPKADTMQEHIEIAKILCASKIAARQMQKQEILYLTILNQYYKWSLTKCRLFVIMFRSAQRIDKNGIYEIIDAINSRNFKFRTKDIRLFKRTEIYWVPAIRLDEYEKLY